MQDVVRLFLHRLRVNYLYIFPIGYRDLFSQMLAFKCLFLSSVCPYLVRVL